ncbi:MAG: hypothetical protein L6R35_006726 [Caloplaca aegaea]|nr:MAG: hypothetical protein L6R35_006726 [Caloplaca aegaea]
MGLILCFRFVAHFCQVPTRIPASQSDGPVTALGKDAVGTSDTLVPGEDAVDTSGARVTALGEGAMAMGGIPVTELGKDAKTTSGTRAPGEDAVDTSGARVTALGEDAVEMSGARQTPAVVCKDRMPAVNGDMFLEGMRCLFKTMDKAPSDASSPDEVDGLDNDKGDTRDPQGAKSPVVGPSPDEEALHTITEDTPLEQAVRQWHQGLSSSQLIDLQETARQLEIKSPLFIGTALSGSDIVVYSLQVLSRHWRELFGCNVQFVSAYACDNDPTVQEFLASHVLHDDSALFPDVEHLLRESALNLLTRSVQIVPYVDIFVAGITCTDRAKTNGSAFKMVNCVQTGAGKTGEAAHLVLQVISKVRPELVILECVSGLAQNTKSSKQSDAEYIVNRLRQLGYGAGTITTDAQEHGSVARRRAPLCMPATLHDQWPWRSRLYWIAVRRRLLDEETVRQWVAATRIPSIPFETFMKHAPDGIEAAPRFDRPLNSSGRPHYRRQDLFEVDDRDDVPCAPSAPKRPREDAKYHDEHMRLYLDARLRWPPGPEDFEKLPRAFCKALEAARLTTRQKEVLYYLEHVSVFEAPVGSGPWFLDVNMSIGFLSGQDGSRMGYSMVMPTLTTKSQIWCPTSPGTPVTGPLTQLAGNAFSAFGIGPVVLGALHQLRAGVIEPMSEELEDQVASEASALTSDSD